ncbi:MAG: sulfatase [Acidobacteriota bacterium]
MLILSSALTTVACEPSREQEIPVAVAVTETELIDLGKRVARPWLISGWGHDEAAGQRDFVWGLGPASEFYVAVLEPRDLLVRLVGRPFDGTHGLRVGLEVGGRFIDELPLPPQGGAVEFRLARETLVQGANVVRVSYSRSRGVGTVGEGGERRNLAVAWDRFEFRAAERGSEYPVAQAVASPDSGVSAAEYPGDCSTARNVIVYLVDTLRADRTGVYGYGRGTTPRLDAFAQQSLVARHAVAQSPWTRPSVASIFTGLTTLSHGVNARNGVLSEELVTLAEILGESGFATAGIISNPNVAGRFGFRQGFDTYDLLRSRRNRAKDVSEEALQWLAGRDSERPFFLYLHTIDPHGPYQPEEPYREQFAPAVGAPEKYRRPFMRRLVRGEEVDTERVSRDLSDLYDGEIAQNDAAFGNLLDQLDTLGLSDSTAVVFLSDHGEEFYEHGRWEHGRSLYGEVLDVPLILRLPGCSAQPLVGLSQHVDLLPTLLDALRLEAPIGIEGRSLLRPADGRPAVSHLEADGFGGIAVTTDQRRLIVPWRNLGPSSMLFDRSVDPGESTNLVGQRPLEELYLAGVAEKALAARRRNVRGGEAVDLSEEARRQLEALGYIN